MDIRTTLARLGIESGPVNIITGIPPKDRVELDLPALIELIKRAQPQTTFPTPQIPGIGTTLIDSIGQEWTVTHQNHGGEVGVSRYDMASATPWHFHAVSDNGGTVWYIGEPDNMVRPRNDTEWEEIARENEHYHNADRHD